MMNYTFNDPAVIRAHHKPALQWCIYAHSRRWIIAMLQFHNFPRTVFKLVKTRPGGVCTSACQVDAGMSDTWADAVRARGDAVPRHPPRHPSKPRPGDAVGSRRKSNTSRERESARTRLSRKERAPPPRMLYDSKLISEPVGGKYTATWRMDGWEMGARGRMVGW